MSGAGVTVPQAVESSDLVRQNLIVDPFAIIAPDDVFRDDGILPGIWDGIRDVRRNPASLSFWVNAGVFSPRNLTNFIANTRRDFLFFQNEERLPPHELMVGPEWLTKFVNYFSGYTARDKEFAETWLPLTEIHRPQIRGCAVELSLGFDKATTNSFKVTALGFAGGGGYTRAVKTVSSGRSSKTSLKLEVRAELQLTEYVSDRNDRITSVSVKRIFDETRYVTMPSDNIEMNIDQLVKENRARAISSPPGLDSFSDETAIETGSVHEFSLNPEVETKAGGKYSFDIATKSEITTRARLKYELATGRRYAFVPQQPRSHVYLVVHDTSIDYGRGIPVG